MNNDAASAEPRRLPKSVYVLLWCLGFTILASYAVVRPAIESLFLREYGSRQLPMVWVAVTVCAGIVVIAFNRGYGRFGFHHLFFTTVIVWGALEMLLLALYRHQYRPSIWLLYVWKDIYIVSLVELLWTAANIVFSLAQAKKAYGWFCLSGSLGGLAGNRLMEYAVGNVGSVDVLYLALPLFLIAAFWMYLLHRLLGDVIVLPPLRRGHFVTALWHQVREKHYVTLLIALVCVVQVVITLTDFQFQFRLEQAIPDLDKRTELIGRVYGGVDALSMMLQLSTSLILKSFGVPLTFLAIPVIVGTSILAFVTRPTVGALIVAKIASKGFDYSIFRSAKEILYIPLSVADKTAGKTLVDILTYRSAKAIASLILFLFVQFSIQSVIGWFVVALVVVWFTLSTSIVQRFRHLSSNSQ